MAKARPKVIGKRRREEALTAAASKINLTDSVYGSRRGQQQWQQRAWQMFDEIGEVSFAANYMGDAFSRIRFFIGTEIDNDLIELNPDEPPEGFRSEDIKTAQGLLDKLDHPNGLSEIQRMAGIALFQVGELYLLGREVDGQEEWQTCSTEQIVVDSDGKHKCKSGPDDRNPAVLGGDDVLIRVWRRYPRWPNQAHSAIRSALTILEELLLLTLEVRAATMSRIPAGILAIPDTMELVRDDTTDDADSDGGRPSTLMEAMMQHFTEPLHDPGSAASTVPFLLKADKEDIEAMRDFKFGRELTKESVALRGELIDRFASAVNLPNEIITGKVDLNHWSAWQVNEDAINNHIAPNVEDFTNALTRKYLIPLLIAEEIEQPERFLILPDISPLIGSKDETQEIFDSWDRVLISNVATRTRLGISEDEAPDDVEFQERVARQKSKQPSSINEAQPPSPKGPRTASASETQTFPIASTERELRIRLQVAADSAMRRALERAGAKLRSLAQRDKKAKSVIASSDIANELIVSKHPGLLSMVETTPEELLQGAFEGYGKQWEREVQEAQASILQLVADSHTAALSKRDIDDAMDEYDSARSRTAALLLAGLSAEALARMYDPNPKAPLQGEFEPNMSVPAGMIRASLAGAGGSSVDIGAGSVAIGLDGRPVDGLYSASLTMGLFRRSDHISVGSQYRWVYGDPLTRKVGPFPPHLRLNGRTFSSWNDSILQNGGGWPSVSFYYPGDHRNCGCNYDYSIEIGAKR